MDPICAHCGKLYSQHYHEPYPGEPELRHYCFTNTTGDIFSDTPDESILFEMACEEDAGLYNRLLDKWRQENCHVVTPPPTGEHGDTQ